MLCTNSGSNIHRALCTCFVHTLYQKALETLPCTIIQAKSKLHVLAYSVLPQVAAAGLLMPMPASTLCFSRLISSIPSLAAPTVLIAKTVPSFKLINKMGWLGCPQGTYTPMSHLLMKKFIWIDKGLSHISFEIHLKFQMNFKPTLWKYFGSQNAFRTTPLTLLRNFKWFSHISFASSTWYKWYLKKWTIVEHQHQHNQNKSNKISGTSFVQHWKRMHFAEFARARTTVVWLWSCCVEGFRLLAVLGIS